MPAPPPLAPLHPSPLPHPPLSVKPSSLDPQKVLERDVLSLRKGCASRGHSPVRLTGPTPGQARRENHKGPPSPLSRCFHGPGMGPSREGPAETLPTGHSTQRWATSRLPWPRGFGPLWGRLAVEVLKAPSQVHGRMEATKSPTPGIQGHKALGTPTSYPQLSTRNHSWPSSAL